MVHTEKKWFTWERRPEWNNLVFPGGYRWYLNLQTDQWVSVMRMNHHIDLLANLTCLSHLFCHFFKWVGLHACVIVSTQACPLRGYSCFQNGIVQSLSYGRISVFHLKDLHPATAVWEASPISLLAFCTAFTVSESLRLCTTLFHAQNDFCFCIPDKIEEAQKELKDPKGSQKGKRSFDKVFNESKYFFSSEWKAGFLLHQLDV